MIKAVGIIYCAQSLANQKVYIGQTVESLGERKSKHQNEADNGNDCLFARALRKYELIGFDWRILCDISAPTRLLLKDYLDIMERIFIKQYESMNRNKGYNRTEGGGGSIGFKHKKSSKRKMSETHTGLTFKHTKKRKKVFHTEEAKRKISISKMGNKNPMYGKSTSELQKQRAKEVHTGKIVSLESRRRQSESMKKSWVRRKVI